MYADQIFAGSLLLSVWGHLVPTLFNTEPQQNYTHIYWYSLNRHITWASIDFGKAHFSIYRLTLSRKPFGPLESIKKHYVLHLCITLQTAFHVSPEVHFVKSKLAFAHTHTHCMLRGQQQEMCGTANKLCCVLSGCGSFEPLVLKYRRKNWK